MKVYFRMVDRSFWLSRLYEALKRRPLVWLAGVRRSGKTSLCRQIAGADYYDCELPSVRREVENEKFWETRKNKTIILDEVHRLSNPAEILKIAADHHPTLKVVATGSSTLAATRKFKDSLTGRKTKLWLTPMNYEDNLSFDRFDLKKRLLKGGLPPFYMGEKNAESEYQEWLDSFWAKDIQELFRIGNRNSFIKFFELMLAQSGGIFEAQSFSKSCEVSRPTILSYLSILETTLTAHIVRPYSKRLASEIIAAPKVYAFDTGFISFAKGLETLSQEACGDLFEHWVLNQFHSILQDGSLNYWRDKAGHEIDFVWKRRGKAPIAIECKWNSDAFDKSNLMSFRGRHPEGENVLISLDRKGKTTFQAGPHKVIHLDPSSLSEWILSKVI